MISTDSEEEKGKEKEMELESGPREKRSGNI
jgi:hypothetical protein